jgi:amino acid adenylation domain-containing protein
MAIFRPEQAMSASLSIPVTGHPKPIYESIGGRFSDIATHFPNRVAVTSGPLSWTYSELEDHSNAIASKVLDLSDEHAKTVALLMKQDAPLVAATLGVLKAGKIYLSLDATLPNARLADILNNSGATLLITDPANVALAKSLAREKIRILEYTPESLHSPARAPDIAVPPDSGAWLMYTSGSTGTPKGVWQNHRNVLCHADLYRALIKSVPDDRFTLLTSFSLAASATHLFAALTSGAQLCLFSVRTHGVARLAEWITAERITVYHSVPTIFRRMMRARATASPYQSVRLIRLGGEPMRREDVDLFRQGFVPSARLMNALSSTETGLFSFLFLDHETPPESDPLPVGRPASGTEVVLLDEQRRPVPQGAEGTIAVRSPYLARGYWNQPQQSHEVFRDSLPGIPSGPPLFLSNDRGRFRPDGLLVHLGRSDQLMKIRGQRLDLNEVEYALRATGLFEESAVVAITKQSGDHHLVAAFVSKQGASPSTETCRKSLLPFPSPLGESSIARNSSVCSNALGKIVPVLPRSGTILNAHSAASGRKNCESLGLVATKISSSWAEILSNLCKCSRALKKLSMSRYRPPLSPRTEPSKNSRDLSPVTLSAILTTFSFLSAQPIPVARCFWFIMAKAASPATANSFDTLNRAPFSDFKPQAFSENAGH